MHKRVAILLLLICSVAPLAGAHSIVHNVTDLGTLPGGNASYANGIDDFGQVVGSAYILTANTNAPNPFLYNHGVMHNLGTLGGVGGSATAINNGGQVLGGPPSLEFRLSRLFVRCARPKHA